MRPLQDQCEPTLYEDLEKLFLSDEGQSITSLFESFDRKPIGVASLAQVHVGRLRATGQEVAVKVSLRIRLSLVHVTVLTAFAIDSASTSRGILRR